jgi:DNA-binding NarL/FixJ family response regulator
MHHGPIPRVLVADDHRPVLERVVAMLDGEFSVVGTASDGIQVIEAEAALHPDVLVLDVCMPGMGGLEAAARIRDRGSRVPVVCMTAFSEADLLDSAWEAGVSAYVAKISLAEDLVPAIRAALEGRRFVSARIAAGQRSTV